LKIVVLISELICSIQISYLQPFLFILSHLIKFKMFQFIFFYNPVQIATWNSLHQKQQPGFFFGILNMINHSFSWKCEITENDKKIELNIRQKQVNLFQNSCCSFQNYSWVVNTKNESNSSFAMEEGKF
jgi:hypothetical protein